MSVFRSLSLRLALTAAGVFAASFACLLAAYYWVNVTRPTQALERRIEAETGELTDGLIVDGAEATTRRLAELATIKTRPLFFAAYRSPEGHWRLFNLPVAPRITDKKWLKTDADVYQEGLEIDRYALLRVTRLKNGAVLVIGRDMEEIEEIGELITQAAIWVIPLTLALSLAGGMLMSLAIGRRLDKISRAALSVMEGDLSNRVPLSGSNDDFDRLAATLNLMLDRVEQGYFQVRQVSDNVAHELKRPIARVSAELAFIDKLEDPAAQRAFLRVEQEIIRLSRLINSLLRISRIEAGRHPIAKTPVSLARLIEDVCDYYRPEAERQGLQLTVKSSIEKQTAGDPDLLFQLIANLIDNAIKFSGASAGTEVQITLTQSQRGHLISVADDGIGSANEDISRLGERFFRGDQVHEIKGDGLGLSLCSAIVKAHGGYLQFRRLNPGLEVRAFLPAGDL